METLNLTKNQKIDLTKTNPGLKKLVVGLGWDVSNEAGQFDLDASAALLNEAGKLVSLSGFVFFNNLEGTGVKHSGDNLTGEGDGDDEKVYVTLADVPADVKKISFAVTIFDAAAREQNFGMVQNAFVRVVDEDSNKELARYDLGEDFSMTSTVVLGDLYRHNGEWKFTAVGAERDGDINALVASYQ